MMKELTPEERRIIRDTASQGRPATTKDAAKTVMIFAAIFIALVALAWFLFVR